MRNVKIVWLPSARADLAAIELRIARQAPRAAIAFVNRLEKATKRLHDFPEVGGYVADFEHLQLRELIHGNYRIVYRYRAKRVEILGVFHASQQLPERKLREM